MGIKVFRLVILRMAWISTILFFSSLLVSVLIEKIYDTVKTVFDYILKNFAVKNTAKEVIISGASTRHSFWGRHSSILARGSVI